MSSIPVGILGMGVGIPDVVRRNSDWPEEFSRKFMERKPKDFTTAEAVLGKGKTAAQELALQHMRQYERQPFRGSVERRVLPRPQPASTLDVLAAREALVRSGVDRRDIGLVVSYALPPDHVAPNNGNLIARALELRSALAIGIEVGCSSFLVGMHVAAQAIASGHVKNALVVASALFSRILDYEAPSSVNAGDGAAAAVLGRTNGGRGILGYFARTDPSLCDSVVVDSRAGGPWYESDVPVTAHSPKLDQAMEMVVNSGEYCRIAMNEVLGQARLSAKDVTSFFAHQPGVWFNEVCRASAGLEHAKTVDTFRRFTSVGAASVATNLYFGIQEGLVRHDDVVALFSSGAGFNWAATLLKWGP